jgi:hypothetical protein
MTHINDEVRMDYFAVSLPDFVVFENDPNHLNRVHCHYMMALGYMGLDSHLEAQQQFNEVWALNASHFGAFIHRSDLQRNDHET